MFDDSYVRSAVDRPQLMNQIAEHIPIVTTLFCAFFAIEIAAHFWARRTTYLLRWTIGVITFGLGTATESINVLFGWSAINFKIWYIVGALLGGFPLAQGSVYLLTPKRFANATALAVTSLVVIAIMCVMRSPADSTSLAIETSSPCTD